MRSTAKQLASWLEHYGAEPFFEIVLDICQDARGRCKHCEEPIFLDFADGGGCPDWCTEGGDYGCADSPDTTDDGTGGHAPMKGRGPA